MAARDKEETLVRKSRRGSLASIYENDAKSSKGAGGAAEGGVSMFADADAIKDQAHKNITEKEYDVADYYYEHGVAQYIARSSPFGNSTLLVITLNAFWIGIETELNEADNLHQAEWYFQAGEYFFCVFFTFEWVTRFLAFKRKRDGFGDKWFSFDTLLVGLMIIETLIIPNAFPPPADSACDADVDANCPASDSGGAPTGQLSLLRMLRLLRLTRMVRLMRAVPELVTLLRSMALALRSVMSTLALLLIFIYIFAIIIKSQMPKTDDELLHEKFGRLSYSMWTLLCTGTFMDDITQVSSAMLQVSWALTALFIIFVMLSSFTVLNMLVGLLCEVISAISALEKEKVIVQYVRGKLMGVLEMMDEDGNGTISRAEFITLLEKPEAVQALTDLGVDVPNLMTLSDHLFEAQNEKSQEGDRGLASSQSARRSLAQSRFEARTEVGVPNAISDGELDSMDESEGSEEQSREMTHAQFLETVIRLRPTHQPCYLDIVDLRKLILRSQRSVMRRMEFLEEMNTRLKAEMQVINEGLSYFTKKDHALVVTTGAAPLEELKTSSSAGSSGYCIGHEEGEPEFDLWEMAQEGDFPEIDSEVVSTDAVNIRAISELPGDANPGKAFAAHFSSRGVNDYAEDESLSGSSASSGKCDHNPQDGEDW